MIQFFNKLLQKAIVIRATGQPAVLAFNAAERQYRRSEYVLKVLKAPAGIRSSVRTIAAASDSPGQKSLAALLSMFEVLSPVEKKRFIIAYMACSSMHGALVPQIVRQTTYQPGQLPPHYEP